MSNDFVGKIFTNSILIQIEAAIQKCSKLVVSNPEKQVRSVEHKSITATLHNSFLKNTFFCETLLDD